MTGTRSLAYGWYYRKEGSPAGLQGGPFSWERLYAYAQNGSIGPGDLVWNIELPEWVPASQVPGLLGGRQPAGTARPVPTPPPIPAPTRFPGAPASSGRPSRPSGPTGPWLGPRREPVYGRSTLPSISPPRGTSVLAWLLPLIALVVVGAGFGVYFGLLRDGSGNGAGTTQASLDPMVVTAADGATVTFPTFGGDPGPGATLTQVTAPSGEVVDDAMIVSGEYALRVSDSSVTSGDVIVSLPLATDLLPADWDPAGLTPEALNPASGQWEPVGQVVGYDEATQEVVFDVPYASYAAVGQVALTRAVSPAESAPVPAGQDLVKRASARALASGSTQSRYRIRFHFFSNWVTYVPAGDHNFEVIYYPLSGLSYSVRKDADWPPSNSWVTLPKVPDYVEDLSHALEKGYAGLLGIEKSGGELFQPLTGAEEVTVANTGAVEGQTSLFWGTVKISNSRIGGYEQLEQVATHELTHLLCDQYYNSASAAANRWFFEATAEYLAARARGLSEAERGRHYASPSVVTDVYLSIPLTASDVSSYYAAAHFLDWCSKRYGATLVPTALEHGSLHPLGRDDVRHFSAALESHGEPGGIGAAYGAYVRALLTTPEDYGGASQTFKSNITTYAEDHGHVSSTVLDEYTTYTKLSLTLPPLSSTGVYLLGRNSDNALLVIDSRGSTGEGLQATTYDAAAADNAFYQSTPAVDSGMSFPYPQTVPVAHFGRLEAKKVLEQFIANTSTTQTARVEVAYYLLRPPPVTSVEDGAVAWSIAKLGNMPRELVRGYHVYKDGVRLTSSPVSIPAEGYPELRYETDQIKAGDTIVVQVVDRAGNAWPQIAPAQQPETTTTTEAITTTEPSVTVTVPDTLPQILSTTDLRAAIEQAARDAGLPVVSSHEGNLVNGNSWRLEDAAENVVVGLFTMNSATDALEHMQKLMDWGANFTSVTSSTFHGLPGYEMSPSNAGAGGGGWAQGRYLVNFAHIGNGDYAAFEEAVYELLKRAE